MVKGYGQLVIGPPGSGKSTYCKEMASLLSKVGRKVTIINIDPANEVNIYENCIDISTLITVQDVMKHKHLGPNGGLVFCIEYLEENMDWLIGHLQKLHDHYFIFDCPGQIELYTHHNSMKAIMKNIQTFGLSICAVNIMDSHYCSDPGKFISALLVTLLSMLQLELPHINVLSKIDLLKKYGEKLAFSLEYYTEVLELKYLLECLQEDPLTSKYHRLNSAIASLVEDYSLVSFMPLNVKDERLMLNLKKAIDKANGFVYNTSEEQNIQTLLACAIGAESDQDRFGIDNDLYNPSSIVKESNL